MKVVSLRIGKPIPYSWQGQEVLSGIRKEEVEGPVAVTSEGLEGDGQADRKNHGGLLKAVYAYGAEEYLGWREFLQKPDLAFGAFGENLTISELNEKEVAFGDQLQVGTAILEAIQPRQPCFKLNFLHGDQMLKQFWERQIWGIYFRVVQPGEIRSGDTAIWIRKAERRFPIYKLMSLLKFPAPNKSEIDFVLSLEGFPEELKTRLRTRLVAK